MFSDKFSALKRILVYRLVWIQHHMFVPIPRTFGMLQSFSKQRSRADVQINGQLRLL